MKKRLILLSALVLLLLSLPSVSFAYLIYPHVYHSVCDLYPYGSSYIGSVAIWGDYAYTGGDGEYANYSVNISNPDDMPFVDQAGYDYGHGGKLVVWDNRLYSAPWFTYLDVYDITTNPGHFNLLGNWRSWTAAAFGLDVSNNRAYVMESNYPARGLRIVDVSKPWNMKQVGFMTPENGGGGIAVRGSYAYITDDHSLKVINISNESSPYEMWGADIGSLLSDIDIRDDFLYVTTVFDSGGGGMHVFDISDQLSPVEVAFVPTVNGDLCLHGNYAFTAGGSGFISTVDISNPRAPALIGKTNLDSFSDSATVWEQAVAGKGKYIYVGTNELFWVNGNNEYKGKVYSLEALSSEPDDAGPKKWLNFTPTEASWDTEYFADLPPAASSPAWTVFEGSEINAAVSGGILRINDTTGSSDVRWRRNWDATNTRGATVLFRAKCDSYDLNGTPLSSMSNILIEDGRFKEEIVILPTKIKCRYSTLEYALTGSLWHTYRVTTQGSQFKIYLDEAPTPIISYLSFGATTKRARVVFGTASNSIKQDISFDFIQSYSNGVFGPSAVIGDTTPDISATAYDIGGKGSLTGINPFSASVYWSTNAGTTWQAGGWDTMYEGNALPTASAPVWTLTEGTEVYASVNSGILRVNDNALTGGSKAKWGMYWGMSRTTGATVMARARCASASGDISWLGNIVIEDGLKYERFKITPTELTAVVSGASYSLDGTAWHTYRITTKNSQYKVYLDENPTPIMTGAMVNSTANNRLVFGGGENPATQDIYFDYVYYTLRGEILPGGTTVQVTCAGNQGDYKAVVTAYGIPFNQYSHTQNKVKFSLRDMAGNLAYSPVYNVRIDNFPPPSQVNNFTAKAFVKSASLSWDNPPDASFTGTMIRYKTTGYPSDTTDGTLLIDKANVPGSHDTYAHTGLTTGTTYYYAAFSHNSIPMYASAASASDTPNPPLLNVKVTGVSTIAIDGNTSDWDLPNFTTKTRGGEKGTGDIALIGYDGGTCYYAGSALALPANAADHTAKVYSRHNAAYLYFLVRCDDSQMNFANPTSTNWANDCVEFYIDPSHNHGASPMSGSTSDIQLVIDANNQKNVYMTTPGYASTVLAGVTSAVVRDGSGWWAEVSIAKAALDPDMPANGTIGVEFFFRDNDDPDATEYAGDPATSTFYSWIDPGQGGFLKVPDTWGDASLPDLTPPAVSSVADEGIYTGSLSQLSCSWTPGGSDSTEYQYAIGTTAGGVDIWGWTNIGSATNVKKTGLTLSENETYYFSVKAGNGYGYWSAYVSSDGITTAPGVNILQAKELADGAPTEVKALRGKIVSAVFDDCFYIKEPLGYYGVKATPAAILTEGQTIDIAGVMKGEDAERYIDCSGNAITVTDAELVALNPLALGNMSLGGVDLNIHTLGVKDGVGPNTIGSLVTVFGKVTAKETGFFYLDDGCGLLDTRINPATGQPYIGVKILDDTSAPVVDEYWTATGISTLEVDGSNRIRAVKAKQSDKLE